MRDPVNGFGQAKVRMLLGRLDKYYALYHVRDLDFLIYPLSTIQEFISYTKSHGTQIPEIEQTFAALVEKTQLREKLNAECGIVAVKKKRYIQKHCHRTFTNL